MDILKNMSFEETDTAASVLDCILRYGAEACRFYKDKNLISAERFDALCEIAKEEAKLIKKIDAALTINKSRVKNEVLEELLLVYEDRAKVLILLRKAA